MAARILQANRFYRTAIRLQKQKEGNGEVVQVSGVRRAVTIPFERRCEVRMKYRRMCSYEVLEASEEESLIIEQGEAFALNRSTEGMLLFIGRPLHAKQLIRVCIAQSGWGRMVNVFESRWVKSVQVESLGDLYLVGCRRISVPATIPSIVQMPRCG